MAVIVPSVIFYFLDLFSFDAWVAIAVPSFFGWCVAEFVSNILSRPRLENRSPRSALKEWEPRSGIEN